MSRHRTVSQKIVASKSSPPPAITDVVVANDTLRTVVPPVVRLRTNATSQVNLTTWNVSIAQSTGAKKQTLDPNTKEYERQVPQDRIEWNTAGKQHSSQTYVFLQCISASTTKNWCKYGGFGCASCRNRFHRKNASKVADKVNTFGLLLFDFNKAEVSGQNSSILDYVRERMRPESRITITGYRPHR